MPAIISESENDQTFIYNLHSRFAVILGELETGNQRIHALDEEEVAKGTQHKQCRDQEYLKCYGDSSFTVPAIEECSALCATHQLTYGEGKRPCEMNLYHRWEAWVTAENELRTYHDHISGLFCPTEANGTTKTFRTDAASYMHEYMIKKEIVDQRLEEYDMKVECCNAAHEALDVKSADCNTLQTELEEKACEHAAEIHSVLTTFYRDFAQASSAYNCAEEEVRQLEADRKKEWVTLEVVRCLLSRIRAQNGVPCDESTNQVTEEIGFCEERHATDVCTITQEEFDALSSGFHADGENHELPDTSAEVSWGLEDVRKLCIDYPAVPAIPPTCADRHNVVGQCIPEPIATPCSQHWTHYDALPGFPQAEFSSTNPGCNAYPACTACDQPPTPEYEELDTCPGYTVDGCDRDGDGDANPLTYIRSVEGVADVRCCSGTDECQSQGFEPLPAFNLAPVDFTTPNEGTHTACYFDVTYQEAMHICHSAGKRICTVAEMNSNQCCGTGCWHNHHPIWVDAQGLGNARGVVQYQTHDQAAAANEALNNVEHRAGQDLSGQVPVPEALED